MRKPVGFLMSALVIAAAYFIYQNVHLRNTNPGGGVRAGGPATSQTSSQLPPARASDTIRIASFNLQVFGETKMSKPHVVDLLARIVRQFDIVAVQEVNARSQDILPLFVDHINATGGYYDYVIGPRLGRTNSKEQYAIIFDRASVEVDRHQLYTVEDVNDQLHREPLVAWFRARGSAANEAFTFSLVDMHVDPDLVAQEVNALDDVFLAVRNDGRDEDDVILLGDFNADDRHLGQLGQLSNLMAVVSRMPTNTRGTAQLDNLLFDQQATTEFTGRGGVFDFLREYNLTVDEALEISDHLPVWAEFSVFEGGTPGRFANRPGTSRR